MSDSGFADSGPPCGMLPGGRCMSLLIASADARTRRGTKRRYETHNGSVVAYRIDHWVYHRVIFPAPVLSGFYVVNNSMKTAVSGLETPRITGRIALKTAGGVGA